MKLIFVFILILAIVVAYDKTYLKNNYEICDGRESCKRVSINPVQPSIQTFNVCNDQGLCERVPVNRLLLKGGTDKKYCSGYFNPDDFVDNWWNSEGLIDECEIPPKADMQFIFKAHNQTIYSYTGITQIKIDVIEFENTFKALQVFTGEDKNNDNLPDDWKHCGNVDEISGRTQRYIQCNGTNLKFVKLVNAEWNKGSLFIDVVEVLKI